MSSIQKCVWVRARCLLLTQIPAELLGAARMVLLLLEVELLPLLLELLTVRIFQIEIAKVDRGWNTTSSVVWSTTILRL